MTGRHAGEPDTFDATVSDYVTGRARELIRQFDYYTAQPADLASVAAAPEGWAAWIGAAAEILRELTRDA